MKKRIRESKYCAELAKPARGAPVARASRPASLQPSPARGKTQVSYKLFRFNSHYRRASSRTPHSRATAVASSFFCPQVQHALPDRRRRTSMFFTKALPICLLLTTASAATAHDIVGTWASKSMAVVTGPGFFNPLTDSLLEPNHTGVSYSFTDDGFYESAIYTITGNPTDPACPTGVLQWAHGSYTLPSTGGIDMVPIAVDGRQLVSTPCTSKTGTYIRFSTNDTMQSYTIALDGYRGEYKLTLNRLYGSPVQPLYLIYDPPQMLPTTTLLPTSTGKSKRSLDSLSAPSSMKEWDKMWYASMGMIALGLAGFICT